MSEKADSVAGGEQDSLQEVMGKIEEAERLLRDVREMLGAGVSSEAEQVSGDVSAPTPESASGGATVTAVAHREPIEALFRLAISPPTDPDQLEISLGDILHTKAKAGPRAIHGVIRFPWAKFSKSFASYLSKNGDSDSFKIVRSSPADLSEADQAKVFLAAKGRQSAPVELARDDAAGNAWRILSFSL